MNELEILEAGRALIADPAHWGQGVAARRADGKETSSTALDACAWCSLGAIRKVTGRDEEMLMGSPSDKARSLLDDAAAQLWENTGRITFAWAFNDTQEHAEVLRMWDLAIENAKKG